MAGGSEWHRFREHTRTSLKAPVSLEFGSDEEFSGLLANLSEGGMFVPSRSPKPVGTLLRFRIQLPGAPQPVSGYGEVVWIRVRSQSPERPPGMGVQFRHVESDGRELLVAEVSKRAPLEPPSSPADRRPVVRSRDAGGPAPPGPPPAAVVDATPDPSGGGESGEPAPVEPPRSGAPAAGRRAGAPPWSHARKPRAGAAAATGRPRWRLPLAVALVAVLVAGLLAFALGPAGRWLVGGSPEPVRGTTPEVAPGVVPAAGEGGDSDSREPAAGAPPAPAAAPAPGPVPAGSAPGDVESDGAASAAEDGGSGLAATGAGPDSGEPSGAGGAVPEPGEVAETVGSAAPGVEPVTPPPVVEGPPDAGAGGEPPAPAPAFSRLVELTWSEVGESTVVTVTADGPIPPDRILQARIGGPLPREVLRFVGVEEAFPRAAVQVGSAHLERIRSGHHPERRPAELHLVLDLAGPGVRIVRLERAGRELRVYLAREQ